jgi:hypothetical protein
MSMSRAGKAVLGGLACVALGAVLLFAAGRLREHDPVTLQTYEVAPEIASELRSALTSAFLREPLMPLGRVNLLPNGRLLVTAPESLQAGVRRLIREIGAKGPGPTPAIRFETWIVAATPGALAQPSADLAEIEPALAVIRRNKGELRFSLLEKLSTVARAGHEGSEVRGASARMEVQATLRNAGGDQPVVAAKLEIAVQETWGRPGSGVSLEAQTELRPGELLVVGQSSGPQDTAGRDSQVYYVVRATL